MIITNSRITEVYIFTPEKKSFGSKLLLAIRALSVLGRGGSVLGPRDYMLLYSNESHVRVQLVPTLTRK
jgi:hypothetical protein